jgi:hypothetical protein
LQKKDPPALPAFVQVLKPSKVMRHVPNTSNSSAILSSDLNINKEPSVNLIQKAHGLYNLKHPQKVISAGNRPPLTNNIHPDLDLPTIDEAEQKEEQNTFA